MTQVAEAQSDLHTRTLRVLVGSQVLGGLGLAAGVTVGALLAEDVLGATSLAGLPAALLTLGSRRRGVRGRRAVPAGGRRRGLAAGYAAGALGGALVVVGAALPSTALLLLGLLVYGAGTATSLQARYAGADLAPPDDAGRAVSTVLRRDRARRRRRARTSSGRPARSRSDVGHPRAGRALRPGRAGLRRRRRRAARVRLRPDPLLVARALAAAAPAGTGGPTGLDRTALRLGGTVMVVTQLVMVAVMTMTPVHMRDHGHGLGATGLVIGLHVGAMFLPSPVTGRLADRYGPRPVAVGGGAVACVAAGLLAAAAPDDSVALLALALVLLGLGWNLGLLAGTTLLTTAVPLDVRAGVQGRVDVAVALAGATGGLGSGFVVAAAGFTELSLLGGGLALLVLLAALRPAPVTGR